MLFLSSITSGKREKVMVLIDLYATYNASVNNIIEIVSIINKIARNG